MLFWAVNSKSYIGLPPPITMQLSQQVETRQLHQLIYHSPLQIAILTTLSCVLSPQNKTLANKKQQTDCTLHDIVILTKQRLGIVKYINRDTYGIYVLGSS